MGNGRPFEWRGVSHEGGRTRLEFGTSALANAVIGCASGTIVKTGPEAPAALAVPSAANAAIERRSFLILFRPD